MKVCKCPQCGANLTFTDDRDVGYCEFCGTKISFEDMRVTQRIIDEAEMKRAETEQLREKHRIEIEQKKMEEEERQKLEAKNFREKRAREQSMLKKIYFTVSAVLLIAFIIFFLGDKYMEGALMLLLLLIFLMMGGIYIFSEFSKKTEEKLQFLNGAIRFPRDMEPFEGKKYDEISEALARAGFRNIQCINLRDLTFGILKKPNTVEEVCINGAPISSGGQIYMPDTPIKIKYHGFDR